MRTPLLLSRTIAIGSIGLLLAAGVATAAEIKVMISAGFSEAYHFENWRQRAASERDRRSWGMKFQTERIPVGGALWFNLSCYRGCPAS